MQFLPALTLAGLLGATSLAASAEGLEAGNSKLLLTGGVSSIDGAAGGGLTPWAVIGGYATDHEFGATAFASRLVVPDYALNVYGAMVSWNDRFELSLARQELNASVVVPQARLRLDIVGAKLRVAGDAVLDSDTLMPQIAVGIESKHISPGAAVGGVLDSVGARRNGIDYYASATKLFLAQAVVVNLTLRATRANQNGLLGFESTGQRNYKLQPEASIAWLLRRDLAIGAEVRTQPDKLHFAGEAFRANSWRDVFVAWAPVKSVSATAGWVELGNVVGHARQSGPYLSAQLSY